MNIGVSTPLPAYKVNAAVTASKAEELGFDSIWYAEHPVMPVHTTSPFAGSPDGVIPETYAHFADPFIALAQASGATSTIKLATGITLIPERNPAGAGQGGRHAGPVQRWQVHPGHRGRVASRGD